MTKTELYDILKSDGAKLPRAANFMNKEELMDMFKERFGVDPDVQEQPADTVESGEAEQPEAEGEIKLLQFDESGWCTALNRAYCRGLYRPASFAEYKALKPYAAKEFEA